MTNKVAARLQMTNILLSIIGVICMFEWFSNVRTDPGTARYWALGAVITFATAAVIAVKLWQQGRTR